MSADILSGLLKTQTQAILGPKLGAGVGNGELEAVISSAVAAYVAIELAPILAALSKLGVSIPKSGGSTGTSGNHTPIHSPAGTGIPFVDQPGQGRPSQGGGGAPRAK